MEKYTRISRRTFIKKAGSGVLLLSASPLILQNPELSLDELIAGNIKDTASLNIGPSQKVIEKAIVSSLARGADFADVFVERSVHRVIELRSGKISSIRYNIDQGVGIRVFYGDRTGFAYCEDFSEQSIIKTAKLSADLGKSGKQHSPVQLMKQPNQINIIPQEIPLDSIKEDQRIEVIRKAYDAAKSHDHRIFDVSIDYDEMTRSIRIANSEGTYAEDIQPTVYFKVKALARSDGSRHMGNARLGTKSGFELFNQKPPEILGKEAAEEAITMLKAKDAPSGEMPVVVTNGWGGVLFHEAVGHGLEGDAVAKGTSYYVGKVGQKVASDFVTFVDDTTIKNLRGSYNIDDEGTAAQRKILIEHGILKGFMTDRLSAKQLSVKSTGNGRRQSFRYAPLVRMTNTFIINGKSSPEEIISNTKKGLYAKSFLGGVVDTTSGNFTFTVSQAYLIEDGKITQPVKRVTLIGKGSDALRSIDMVGNDLDFGPGSCGKGQWVTVTSGQPTLRLSKIVVGGTKS